MILGLNPRAHLDMIPRGVSAECRVFYPWKGGGEDFERWMEQWPLWNWFWELRS